MHRPKATRVNLTATNILVNAVYYLVTAALLPWACLAAEDALGISRHPGPALRVAGVIAAGAGAGLQAWCIVLFQRIGGGAPSPVRPTRRLVDRGPYRYVRNPMNLGELLVFLGLAAWFGSAILLAYALAAMLAFHLFIVRHEETRHALEFGDGYAAYRRAVRRWIPGGRNESDAATRVKHPGT